MISKWVFVLFLVMNIVVSGLSRRNPHHHIRRHTSNINSNSKDHSNEQITNRLYTNNDDESISIGEKAREIMKTEEAKVSVPFNERKLEKMLEKAIIKIIMGDLTNADMNLLKSLNYSLTEILTIRNNELAKQEEKKRLEIIQMEKIKSKSKHCEKKKREKFEKKSTDNEDFDFDAFNRQALLDYENLPTEMELQQTRSDDTGDNDYNDQMSKEKNTEDKKNSPDNFHRHFDKAMEPHVVFKIRYDDSEFDSSSSEEKSNAVKKQPTNRDFSNTKVEDSLTNTANSFPPFTSDPPLPLPLRSSSFSSLSPPSSTSLPVISKNLHIIDDRLRDLTNNVEILETHLDDSVNLNNVNLSKNSSDNVDDNVTNDSELKKEDSTTGKIDNGGSDASKSSVKRISEYEGLEWVEDDVYRVIPSLANNLGDYENVEDNESSLNYDDEILSFYAQNTTHCKKNERENDNDTAEYQNDNPETIKLVMANTNLTSVENQSFGSYQQMLQAHRKEGNLTSTFDSQGQKAIEDIKSRVLALTGRFNLSSNANTVQREKLTMFPPTCRLPRNTDEEAWSDPFLMNMHFRLNLTWDEHVIAAKLRIYKLPQENLTLSSTNDSDGDIPDEEDEKRIRISVYYYTRALKKHRARKRLMDSVMTPLTSVGTHLALDIRQGLKFWRVDPRSPYANTGNYGLVIQVEDQDGKPLKPALYIQEPSCPNGDDVQKACNHLPALFIRACTRYVRVVNGETVTYMNCRH